MENTNFIPPEIIDSASEGLFSVDKKTAASHFEFPVQIPPLASGLQPNLAIHYSSQPTKFGPELMSEGWLIKGLDFLLVSPDGVCLKNGQKEIDARHRNGSLTWVTVDGICERYDPCRWHDPDVYQLTEISDSYGNRVKYEFDHGGRPLAISYGYSGLQNRQVKFLYSQTTQKLCTLEMYLESDVVFEYGLQYRDDNLHSIVRLAFNETGSFSRKPLTFDYGLDPSNLLEEIIDENHTEIQIHYQVDPGVVDHYVEVRPEFGGKRSRSTYQVSVGKRLSEGAPLNGFDRIEIWSNSGEFGSFWTYYGDGQFKGSKRTEGVGHERDNQGVIIPTHRTSFTYARLQKAKEPVLVQKDTEEWISENNELPKKTEVYEYDHRGNLLQMCDVNVLRVKRYDFTAEPFFRSVEASNILYDISQSATLEEKNVLQVDYFTNFFDPSSGQLQKIKHVQQMSRGKYANPVTTIFNETGQVEQIVQVDSSVRRFSYDEYGFPVLETLTSPSGAESIHIQKVYCPKTGALLWQKDTNGAVVQNAIDAFGSLQEVYQKDLMRPESWTSDTDLVLTSKQELIWHDRHHVFISTTSKAVGNEQGLLQEIDVLDSAMRPIIQGHEIEPGSWQIQLYAYDVRKNVCRQSLPLAVKGEFENILKKFKRLNKGKIKWVSRYQDYRGKDIKTVYPDGSKRVFEYHVNDSGDLFETITSLAKDGKVCDRQRRLITSDRSLHELNPGDKIETISDFDVLGRIIRKKFGNGSVSEFTWDQAGNCISEKNSMTGHVQRVVGSDHRLGQVSQNGLTTTFQYDWMGRLTEQVEKDVNNEVRRYQVSYKSVSGTHTSKCEMPSGHILQRRYAPTGELIGKEIIEPDGFKIHVETDFWLNGAVRRRNYSDGRSVEYSYDGRGFLARAGLSHELKPLYSAQNHNFLGIPAKAVFANGITEYRKCNAFGQLTDFRAYRQNSHRKACYLAQELQHTDGYPGLKNEVYQTADNTESRFTSYAFDSFQRLKSATQYLENDPEIGCDLLRAKPEYEKKFDGNADVRMLQSESVSALFDYGGAGQLKSSHRQDSSGDFRNQYEYSLEGELFRRETQDGSILLKVDQDYEVIRYKDGTAVATLKVLSEQGAIAEITTALDEAKSTFSLEGATEVPGFSFVPKSAGSIFIHLDFQGSSVLATDAAGALLCRAAFLPFGQIDLTASEGRVGFDLVYAGMLYDPSVQLYDAGARYYSAEFGLFLSADPLKSSENFHAYPTDPINYFDFQGLCRCPNLARSFQENYGRPTNLRGGVLATAVSCFAVFLPVYLYMFGYDFPASLRWTIGLGAWFITASVLGSLFIHLNRSWNGAPADPETYVCGPYGSIFVKTLIATTIAVVYLGPMLSFIGNDDCAPYELYNCSNAFYSMNVVRGTLATFIATPIGGLFSKFMHSHPSRNLSLLRMYGYHLGALWFSYGIWQLFDVLQLRIIYGRDPISVLHFKRAFLTGEIFLGMLLAQPNPVWGLLPALLPANCWDILFSARRRSEEGGVVPWFSGVDHIGGRDEEVPSHEVQIEVLPDIEASDTSETESS